MSKKKGSVLEMMDNIKKNKDKKKSKGLEYNHSVTQQLYDKTKDEFDIDIPPWETKDKLPAGKPLQTKLQAGKPLARRKTIVGQGKGIVKHGKGLIEEALGGKTHAQSVYMQHPAFKNSTQTNQQKKDEENEKKRKKKY
jgi:hypothetical protein